MAEVKITRRDIAIALRQALIERTIDRFNQDYKPSEEHDRKCAGYYVPDRMDEIQATFQWDSARSVLRVSLTEVPCTCWAYVQGATLTTAYAVSELIAMSLEEF